MYRFPALYSEFQNVEGGKRKGERRWRSLFPAESGADVSVAGNRSLSCGFHIRRNASDLQQSLRLIFQHLQRIGAEAPDNQLGRLFSHAFD